MKLVLLCVSLFVVSALTADITEDKVIEMIQTYPDFFVDPETSASDFEKAINSLGLNGELDSEAKYSSSELKLKSQKKTTGTAQSSEGTTEISVEKDRNVDYQCNCSRSGPVHTALVRGSGDKTVKGSCGSHSFNIVKKGKFRMVVEKVHVAGRAQHEILKLAKSYNLTEEVMEPNSACLCLVGLKLGEEESISADGKTVDVCKEISLSMAIAKIRGIGTKVSGKSVKIIKPKDRRPIAINKSFSTMIVV